MSQQSLPPAAKKMRLDNEGSASPAPPTPTPATTTTTPGFSAAQWTTSQIPIDPALSQAAAQPPAVQQPQQNLMSYYQTYAQTTHYGQTAYSSPLQHYQHYQAAQPITSSATVSRQPTQTNDNDGADLSNLNDALGSAGVDLRAEEETLQRSHDHHQAYRPYEDRTRRQGTKFAFDNRILGATMREIGTRHKIGKIPEDSVNYLALALRARLQGLIKAMVAASQHRVESQHNREPSLYEDGSPMWSVVVRRDAQKQLEALEKAEREEEMRYRRERKERADAAAAQAAAAAAAQSAGNTSVDGGDDPMDGSSTKKSKKKKDGPGVTAKNMSEDAQKRLSNATATHAAGLGRGKYAWMTAGNLAAAPPKPKPAAISSLSQTSNATTATTSTTPAASASSWAKPYVPTNAKPTAPTDEDSRRPVTMRDALFVIERERGHGAGQGAAKIWI